MKRTITMLLALVFVFCILPACAFADGETAELSAPGVTGTAGEGDLRYSFGDGEGSHGQFGGAGERRLYGFSQDRSGDFIASAGGLIVALQRVDVCKTCGG